MKISIDKNSLHQIFSNESKRIVGTCLKRFEIPLEIKQQNGKELSLNKEEIENLKSQIKNLLYESMRNIHNIIVINGTDSINLKIKK